MLKKRFLIRMTLSLFVGLMMIPQTGLSDDDGMVVKCRIVELRRRGEIESNRYIIRALSRRGRVVDTFRAMDGRPFSGRSEAELGLFLLKEEGNCP